LVGALGDSEWGVRQAAASSVGQLGQATPEVVAALNRNLHNSDRDVRKAAHGALSKLLDGKPLSGDEWVPLRKGQERPKRKLRRALLLLFALAMALVPLAYLLAALYVPWVRDNLWFLSLFLADVMAWVAFVANIGQIRQTLGDLWR
jgi:HEAT repeat protein